MNEDLNDQDSAERIDPTDAAQRRFLLLHFGEVVESIGCAIKCALRFNTIGEAVAQEESLATFALLHHIDPEITPHDYACRAASAFFLWSKELLEMPLNRKLLAYTIQHDLFAGNQEGWDRYAEQIRTEVPWFGIDLEPVSEPLAEAAAVWPPVHGASPPNAG